MANDSTNPTQVSSDQDATPANDAIFTASSDEDAFFGPEQLAQANAGAPVVVPVPQNENVIRVQVNPGEILELSSPFDAGAALLAREADGNLAIKVGDVTVILLGYVTANEAAPVVIETSDGQPIDIATLLASTDPNIDIQTAAGPGAQGGQGGQGADNTGAILAQLEGGDGLGGFDAVGKQDGTELRYGNIDNSILRTLTNDTTPLLGDTTFKGLSEPFLRDPFTDKNFSDFEHFIKKYEKYVDHHPGDGWADFTGTQANGTDFESYLAQTSFTNLVSHSSTDSETLHLDLGQLSSIVSQMSSNGHELYIDKNSTDDTVFVRRCGDDALVLVIHAHPVGDLDDCGSPTSTGNYQIDTFLINRLDHPEQGYDLLGLDIPYFIPHLGSEEQQEVESTFGTAHVDIKDDIPVVTGDPTYVNFLHSCSYSDAAAAFAALSGGHAKDFVITNDAGHVDEDYIFGGNHDKDNANGPDSDAARGDDIGDKFVVGILNIDFGADGPSGAIPEGDPLKGIFDLACPPALTIDGLCKGEPYPSADGQLTSHGNPLVVLKHYVDKFGIEHIEVGYSACASSDARTFGEGGGDNVTVFTLLLQSNPNLPLFGGFAFEICQPIDHAPGSTAETNLALIFPIIATDDDGDHPTTDINITIQVNDDAPTLCDVDYISWKGGIPDPTGTDFVALTSGGGNDIIRSHDYGQVDEDWLKGGDLNDGGGNQDKDGTGGNNAGEDGDEFGKTTIKGEINVDFGGDGPADCPFSFTKTFDTSGTPPVFKDADGNSYKSGGHDLVVLTQSHGFLAVGYYPDGDGESKPVTIFTVELKDSGKFEFDLCGPIDHTGQNEQTLDIKLGVTASDWDGDTVATTLDFKVNDDKPEVGITYYNNQEHDFATLSDLGELVRVSGAGGNDIVRTTDFGHVDEDWLKGADGNSYIGNQDEDGTGAGNAGQFGDDIGKTEVCGQIDVKYGGDGPSGKDVPFALQTYTVGEVFKDSTGQQFQSHGQDLEVLSFDGSHLVVGIPGQVILGGAETSILGGPTTVFTLDFDSGSGQFNFQLWSSIDHDPQAGSDGDETNTLLSFKVGSVSDNDGDTSDAVIKIQVNDDKPEIDTSYTSYSAAPGDSTGAFDTTAYGLIDEDWIRDGEGNQIGNKDTDNAFGNEDAATGDTKGTDYVTGRLTVSYGGDGEGTSSNFAFTADEGDVVYAKDDNGNTIVLKTDGGETVYAHLVADGGSGTTLLVGFSNPDDSNAYVEGTSSEVFRVALYPNSGWFNFHLSQPLNHPISGTEDNLLLSIGVSAGTDGDGDPAVGAINIRVNDDAPHAEDDSQDFDGPDPETGDVHGNVLTNDKKGADVYVAFVSNVNGPNNQPNGVEIDNGTGQTIAGVNGSLTLYSNGEYHYTPNMGGDLPGPGSDTFTYTLKDADGDTSTATLSFHYTGVTIDSLAFVQSGPTHTVADNYDLTLNVTTGTDATQNKNYHPGDSVEINDTSTGLFGTGIGAGHTLKGGSGDDHIMGNAGNDNLQGRDGNDILEGGDGRDELHGGNGDDTLFGGNNDDELYGDAGHDAMSGGDGSDTFHKVDADDLDGTNTLDGFHTIDGGDGWDTVDISGLKTFDSSQAMRLENVEHLALDGTAAGGGGTAVTLNYDSAYGITQVGGLHVLSITGDKADAVNLVGSGGNAWVSDGELFGTQFFHAGSGGDKVTVTVEHDVSVSLS